MSYWLVFLKFTRFVVSILLMTLLILLAEPRDIVDCVHPASNVGTVDIADLVGRVDLVDLGGLTEIVHLNGVLNNIQPLKQCRRLLLYSRIRHRNHILQV